MKLIFGFLVVICSFFYGDESCKISWPQQKYCRAVKMNDKDEIKKIEMLMNNNDLITITWKKDYFVKICSSNNEKCFEKEGNIQEVNVRFGDKIFGDDKSKIIVSWKMTDGRWWNPNITMEEIISEDGGITWSNPSSDLD